MTATNVSHSKSDKLQWILISVLVLAGVVANYYFSEIAWALRLAGWIILVCILLGLVSTTVLGKSMWTFAKNARMELLKVVWPQRDEVIKITMVIAALVFATSIVLWSMDSVLLWAVSWLTGKLV